MMSPEFRVQIFDIEMSVEVSRRVRNIFSSQQTRKPVSCPWPEQDLEFVKRTQGQGTQELSQHRGDLSTSQNFRIDHRRAKRIEKISLDSTSCSVFVRLSLSSVL
jgi:hypothetical protein